MSWKYREVFVKAFYAAAALAVFLIGANSLADDLSNAQAEQLLLPAMTSDCGSYYTTQGEPDFADLEGKAMCSYKPRVTRLTVNGSSAKAEYNHDRHFDDAMSQAWLKDYAKMEAHDTPSLLFKTLKAHLDKWRAESGGVDSGPRPGVATFKLDGGVWKLDTAPQ
jgi:hypothetical protein